MVLGPHLSAPRLWDHVRTLLFARLHVLAYNLVLDYATHPGDVESRAL